MLHNGDTFMDMHTDWGVNAMRGNTQPAVPGADDACTGSEHCRALYMFQAA